jgi:hypothetical protein
MLLPIYGRGTTECPIPARPDSHTQISKGNQ